MCNLESKTLKDNQKIVFMSATDDLNYLKLYNKVTKSFILFINLYVEKLF